MKSRNTIQKTLVSPQDKSMNIMKFKAIYNNNLYNVRAINWDIELLPNQSNSVFLSKKEDSLQEFEYIQVPLSKVELLQPIAKDINGVVLYKGDIMRKDILYNYTDGNCEHSHLFEKETESSYFDAATIGILHFTVSKGAFLRKAVTWITKDIKEPRERIVIGNARFVQGRCEKIGNIFENPEILDLDLSTSVAGVRKKRTKPKNEAHTEIINLKDLSYMEQMQKIFSGKIIDEKTEELK